MAQTVADMLIRTLEQIDVEHTFGLIGEHSILLPTPFAAATSNGSAYVTKKGGPCSSRTGQADRRTRGVLRPA